MVSLHDLFYQEDMSKSLPCEPHFAPDNSSFQHKNADRRVRVGRQEVWLHLSVTAVPLRLGCERHAL